MNANVSSVSRARGHDSVSCAPIIVIGAGRSGTNMLRDVLVTLPGLGTWPCDEINYIWRHFNARYPTDEFPAELATPKVIKYIRGSFDRLSRKFNLQRVVEKTCANSLRVGFVDRIFPEAQYLFIVRDGRDVVASAMKRWAARLDWSYMLRKARFVPMSDVPYYASRYFANRLYRRFSRRGTLKSWGPRFTGMQACLQDRSMEAVCALQWQRCVELAEADFGNVDPSRVHRVRYEDCVSNTCDEFQRILQFLNVPFQPQMLGSLSQGVHATSVGKWKEDLRPHAIDEIESLLRPTLDKYGYQ